MRKFTVLAGVTAALLSFPAVAQDASGEKSLDGDRLTVGLGAVYAPSYRGSDDYRVTPLPVVQGQVKGIGINPRAGGLSLDFIPDNRDSGFGFSLGPVVTYSGNRARNIGDSVVRRAGKLDDAVGVGVSAGVTAYKLLNPYDSLTISGDVTWDVAGAYKGMVWTPNLTYATPLSKGTLVTLNLSASHVDNKYARYYYSVTTAQSLASGLPVYNARKGFDNVSVGLLGAYDLDGNLLNGGFAIFALGSYSKMLNDGKDTPFTSIRGSANQWVGGAGLAYTF